MGLLVHLSVWGPARGDGTGVQTVRLPISGTPDGCFVHYVDEDINVTNQERCMGYGASDGTTQMTGSLSTVDNVSTTDSITAQKTDQAIFVYAAGANAVQREADITFSDGYMHIDWTTNTGSSDIYITMNFTLFYSMDGFWVGTHKRLPSGTPGPHVQGLSATPSAFLSVATEGLANTGTGVSTNGDLALGCAINDNASHGTGSSHTERGTWYNNPPSVSTTVMQSRITDAAFYYSSAKDMQLSTWNSDGWTTTTSFGNRRLHYGWCAWRDSSNTYDLVSFSTPTATGTWSITGSLGGSTGDFALLSGGAFSAYNTTYSANPDAENQSFGVASRGVINPTADSVLGGYYWSDDNVSTTDIISVPGFNGILRANSATTTADHLSNFDSWVTNGIQLDMTTAPASARQGWALLAQGTAWDGEMLTFVNGSRVT